MNRKKNSRSNSPFPVVGIGASAGGLDAFIKMFANISENTGMGYVVVQHLDPSQVSKLPDLLQKTMPIPVQEIKEKTEIKPDTVYVIPPNKNLSIDDRTLVLSEPEEHPGLAHNIDIFFKSLAEGVKERAVGVILSGTGSDGTNGAKMIKKELGLVVVQSPDTAQYNGMPNNAIASGIADIVLPPERIIPHLIEYFNRPLDETKVAEELKDNEETLKRIFSVIREKTGHDFSYYKKSTINRRIERRMNVTQVENLKDFLKKLKESDIEVQALVKDFLINVTSFFRDPEAFEELKNKLRELILEKPDNGEIRVWIPGCSTGEEPYSIAIIIQELLEETQKKLPFQVFATDLDSEAISTARKGVYNRFGIENISKERVKKFFIHADNHFQVKRDIREKLVFAEQDFIYDPPFSKMDLISARNMLIYFDTEIQKSKLIPMLHYALNTNGILFLGTAESVGDFSEEFITIDRKWKIYQASKTNQTGPALNMDTHWKDLSFVKGSEETLRENHSEKIKGKPLELVLLEALPPTVLINREYDVVFTHGDTGKYLRLPEGRPDTNLIELIRPELHSPLSKALSEALKSGQIQEKEGIRVKWNGHQQDVKIIVRHVSPMQLKNKEPGFLITFLDIPEKPEKKSEDEKSNMKVKDLEEELRYTKENLRSTIEELETANEELKSANEEYQSTNEELQSTNEELETSREELQSVNEELMTVNNEHQKKIEELSVINDDMKNLLNSTGIATLFLNNNLEIQRYTPATTRIFNLIESDIGRPLTHITTQLKSGDITPKAKQVLENLIPIQEKVYTEQNGLYSLRIHPYRTTENIIAGVVISFVDMNDQKKVELDLKETREALDHIPVAAVLLNEQLHVHWANKMFYKMCHLTKKHAENASLFKLNNSSWNIPELKTPLDEILQKEEGSFEVKIKNFFKENEKTYLLVKALTLTNEKSRPLKILLTLQSEK